MRNRLTKLGATVTALAALAFGGSAIASAAQHSKPPAPPAAAQSQQQAEQSGAESNAPETDGDAAAQAAACQKAGIDPNASNIQYDDQTGTCTLDTSGGANQ